MKKSIAVNRGLLERLLLEVEKNGPLPNQKALWDKVAEAYNAQAETKITPSVVYLRVKTWGIVVQTKPGKKGRGSMTDEQKAAMQAARAKGCRPRSEKMKAFSDNFRANAQANPRTVSAIGE